MDLWEVSDLCTPWCVHVAATLRVADHIAAGKTDIDSLAEACGADRDSLYRLLRHLVNKGVFEEPARGTFALNDLARQFLNEGVRLGMDLDSFGGRMANAWGTLLSAVRTGRPAYREAFGLDFWADLEAHPQIAEAFDALMGPGHGTPDPTLLAENADWDRIRTVVDVGGGTGALLAEVLRAHPHLHGILVDLPPTAARSATVFKTAGVADRVTVSAQSFFDPLPAGHDLYILKSVLGDWPDTEATAILRCCGEAMNPAGRVAVFTHAGEGEAASPELLMMVLVGGRDRTLEELRAMGREVGLEMRGSVRQRSSRLIVEFRSLSYRPSSA